MLKIGDLEIGGDAPVACIAELGNAHNGDYNRALRLLDAAKGAGASAAKLQCYSVDELISLRGDGPAPAQWGEQGMSMRDLYSRAMTPREWFAPLYAHAASIGLPIFSSVFGEESLALLESIGNPCYKIARLDNAHVDLIDAVSRTKKPWIVSVGPEECPRFTMFDHPDPAYVARNPGGWAVPDDKCLWCPSGYPQTTFSFERGHAGTEYDDPGTDGTFGDNYLGFSYHGTSIEPPIVAATLGAKVIEAHMMLRDEPSELEANVSLDEYQFAEMIRRVRDVERMLA